MTRGAVMKLITFFPFATCVALLGLVSTSGERIIQDASDSSERTTFEERLISAATTVELNHHTFDGNVMGQSSAEDWVVFFCTSWYGPCDKLLPAFQELSGKWQGWLNTGRLLTSKVRFATVDCAVDKPLCNAESVNAYPTVVHYSRGYQTSQWSSNGRGDEARLAKWLRQAFAEVPAAGSGNINACYVGDSVRALYPNGKYYSAQISRMNDDGTISVGWDDGDQNHRTVPASHVRKGSASCDATMRSLTDRVPPSEHAANIAMVLLVAYLNFCAIRRLASDDEEKQKVEELLETAPANQNYNRNPAVGVGSKLPQEWANTRASLHL